jgi:hypothetical protein
MIGQTFTMHIEKPMSYHERMCRSAGYKAADIDVLVADMVAKGFVEAGDPDAREAACVVKMAQVRSKFWNS